MTILPSDSRSQPVFTVWQLDPPIAIDEDGSGPKGIPAKNKIVRDWGEGYQLVTQMSEDFKKHFIEGVAGSLAIEGGREEVTYEYGMIRSSCNHITAAGRSNNIHFHTVTENGFPIRIFAVASAALTEREVTDAIMSSPAMAKVLTLKSPVDLEDSSGDEDTKEKKELEDGLFLSDAHVKRLIARASVNSNADPTTVCSCFLSFIAGVSSVTGISWLDVSEEIVKLVSFDNEQIDLEKFPPIMHTQLRNKAIDNIIANVSLLDLLEIFRQHPEYLINFLMPGFDPDANERLRYQRHIEGWVGQLESEGGPEF